MKKVSIQLGNYGVLANEQSFSYFTILQDGVVVEGVSGKTAIRLQGVSLELLEVTA